MNTTITVRTPINCTNLDDRFDDNIKTTPELPVIHGQVVTVVCAGRNIVQGDSEMTCSDGQFTSSISPPSCRYVSGSMPLVPCLPFSLSLLLPSLKTYFLSYFVVFATNLDICY